MANRLSASVNFSLFRARTAHDVATPNESTFTVGLDEGDAALVAVVAAQNFTSIFAARGDVALAILNSWKFSSFSRNFKFSKF